MKHLTITINVDYTDETALRENRLNLLEFAGNDVDRAVIYACIGQSMNAPSYAGDVTDKADGSVSYTVSSIISKP